MNPIRLFSLCTVVVLRLTGPARADVCPTEVTFRPAVAASTADTGFTGLGLGRPIFGNTLRLGVSCPSPVSPCGACTITGALPDTEGSFQRCAADTAIRCTPATEVADCGAPGTCKLFVTVPQFSAVGGVTSCYTNELTGPVTGTADENGNLEVTMSYLGRIYLDGGGPACPRCVGDPFANDGDAGGTCASGLRQGQPCDVNGPAPVGYEEVGSSSFDCPSLPATQIATLAPGPVTFSTGTQTRTLTANSPSCTATDAGTKKCFCDTCNDAAGAPCSSDADCPPSGGNPGICGGRRCIGGGNDGAPCVHVSQCPAGLCNRIGEPTKPNPCFDDTSTPVNEGFLCTDVGVPGDGLGECPGGPAEQTCSNHPNRGCGDDADCDDVPGACVRRNRTCYVGDGTIGQSISANGVATPPTGGFSDPTVLGMITCQGSSHLNVVDAALGLPGLARNHHVGTLAIGAAAGEICPQAPESCRAPVTPHKSSLRIADKTPDAKDRFAWRWAKGAATTVPELGDPTTTDAYALCVYDTQGLRMGIVAPAGGLCDGRPCWKPTSTGFVYKRKDGAPRGITKLVLRAGEAGKSQMEVAGKGDFLPLPSLTSLLAPLQVQLRNVASGLCWSTVFPAPLPKQTATALDAED